MGEWENLPGQGRNIRFLAGVVHANRVAHAYLFTGPEGVGKRTAALFLAQGLNCASPREGVPCGQCPACRKIREGNHPDVRVIQPEEGALKIEQIRHLKQLVSLKPYEGRWKIFILDGAETMTDQAANSLLKVLEEPPSDSVLVLLAREAERLLPTIISRCMILPFRPLAVSQTAGILRDQYGLAEENAWLLAGVSGGALGQALAAREDLEGLRGQLQNFWEGLAGQNWTTVLRVTEALEEMPPQGREDFIRLLELTWESFLTPGGKGLSLLPKVVRPSWEGGAAALMVTARARQLLEANVSPRYVFDGLGLILARILQNLEIPQPWLKNWLGVKEQVAI